MRALPASLVLGEEEEDGEALVAGVRPHKAGCSSSAPLNSSQQPKHSTQLRTSLHIGSTHINPLHTVLVNFTLHIFDKESYKITNLRKLIIPRFCCNYWQTLPMMTCS